jgi:chlorite dismutase
MSTRLIERLEQLSDAVAKRRMNEFTMSIPAELERDADIVLSTAASRIAALEAENAKLRENLRILFSAMKVDPIVGRWYFSRSAAAPELDNTLDSLHEALKEQP